MTQLLLALLDRAETAPLVLDAARGAAARLGGAEITALVIRHAPTEGLMPTEEVAGPAALAARAAAEEARIAAIRAAVGETVTLVEREGETQAVIAAEARRGPVLVVGHAPGAERDARQAMDVALFAAGLPSLFVPSGAAPATLGRVIAVAWKPSPAAARAVAAARPWLLAAERVVVLRAEEGAPAGMPPDLASLRAAGIAVEERAVVPAGRSIGRALLAEAHAAGADLLVMGAFTHARWREFLLGGVTRAVLAEADLPVLMQH